VENNEGDEMKAKKAGWPRCAEVHSPENRTGQAWKPEMVQVIGEDYSGNHRLFDLPKGNFRCKECNEIVEVDFRGVAYCLECGVIFNDTIKYNEVNHDNDRSRGIHRFLHPGKA
jgi:hypothetical protein